MKGKIKWFNPQKGFGFIIGEDEQEYFFHVSQILNQAILKENDQVKFEPKTSEKGIQAHKIIKI